MRKNVLIVTQTVAQVFNGLAERVMVAKILTVFHYLSKHLKCHAIEDYSPSNGKWDQCRLCQMVKGLFSVLQTINHK